MQILASTHPHRPRVAPCPHAMLPVRCTMLSPTSTPPPHPPTLLRRRPGTPSAGWEAARWDSPRPASAGAAVPRIALPGGTASAASSAAASPAAHSPAACGSASASPGPLSPADLGLFDSLMPAAPPRPPQAVATRAPPQAVATPAAPAASTGQAPGANYFPPTPAGQPTAPHLMQTRAADWAATVSAAAAAPRPPATARGHEARPVSAPASAVRSSSAPVVGAPGAAEAAHQKQVLCAMFPEVRAERIEAALASTGSVEAAVELLLRDGGASPTAVASPAAGAVRNVSPQSRFSSARAEEWRPARAMGQGPPPPPPPPVSEVKFKKGWFRSGPRMAKDKDSVYY